jgi:hypothetical protein
MASHVISQQHALITCCCCKVIAMHLVLALLIHVLLVVARPGHVCVLTPAAVEWDQQVCTVIPESPGKSSCIHLLLRMQQEQTARPSGTPHPTTSHVAAAVVCWHTGCTVSSGCECKEAIAAQCRTQISHICSSTFVAFIGGGGNLSAILRAL